MKKTVSLLLAIALSLTVFVTDVSGIVLLVRAQDYTTDEDDVSADASYDEVEDDDEYERWMQEMEEEERKRQEAYDKAAKEAEEEAQKQAEIDAAAEEARKQAAEQARRAEEEAEKARQASEEKMNDYAIGIGVGNGRANTVDFGTEAVGVQRDYCPVTITNTGSTDVSLIYREVNDADGAFSMSVHGDGSTYLSPTDSIKYYVAMRSDLPAGDYNAQVWFADGMRDPDYSKGYYINLHGTVRGSSASVTSVTISPQDITLAVGNSYQFYAYVNGTGNYSKEVNWSLAGQRSSGTKISKNGNLTIGNDESSGTFNVMAVSVADPDEFDYATVYTQRNSYNVNAYADPQNGGSVTGGGAVSQGGSVTVSAVPKQNYTFSGWFIDNNKVSTSTNYTIKNINSSMNVVAKFTQRSVTVRVSSNNNDAGNVVGGGNITYGGETTLSAKAYNGYVFTGWKEGDTIISTDASIKLSNLQYDRKITAIFDRTSHTLTLAANPADGGTVSGGGTFKLGTGTTIKATPNKGYIFKGWTVNSQVVSRDASFKINNVDQDYTCTAIFEKEGVQTFEISSGVATTGGSIAPSGKLAIAKGNSITYTITPKAGFAILAVAVDGNQVGAVGTYTFTNVTGPHTISAAFVQTDAGKKATVSSGNKAQSEKVQPISKTTSNTATDNSTVSIQDAAAGTGGDGFIEEMEGIEQIVIPTDEQLGVESLDNVAQAYSEVSEFMGVSIDEIGQMVSTGEKMPVLDAAFYVGSLGANVQNELEPESYRRMSVDYSNMSRDELMQVSDDYINPSLPDLDMVVFNLLTENEVMKLAKGGQVDISVSLSKVSEPDEASKRIMNNAVGQKPVQYFDLTMLKTTDGMTERISELPSSMEVVIEIPKDVYKSGKNYSILRVHNGQVSVLPDLDDDPKTITFRTDRFSSYAIAREVASANSLVAWLIAGAAIAFGVAVSCLLILVIHQNKMRKTRRKRA